LRSATVHDDRVHAHQLEQHDVAREARLEIFIHHGVAAILDHQGLALEGADIRQGLAQDLRDLMCRR